MKKLKCLVLALSLVSFSSVFAGDHHFHIKFELSHTHNHNVRESIKDFFSNHFCHFHVC